MRRKGIKGIRAQGRKGVKVQGTWWKKTIVIGVNIPVGANSSHNSHSVNVWIVPQIRPSWLENYIESYANKPDRAKMGC